MGINALLIYSKPCYQESVIIILHQMVGVQQQYLMPTLFNILIDLCVYCVFLAKDEAS